MPAAHFNVNSNLAFFGLELFCSFLQGSVVYIIIYGPQRLRVNKQINRTEVILMGTSLKFKASHLFQEEAH